MEWRWWAFEVMWWKWKRRKERRWRSEEKLDVGKQLWRERWEGKKWRNLQEGRGGQVWEEQ